MCYLLFKLILQKQFTAGCNAQTFYTVLIKNSHSSLNYKKKKKAMQGLYSVRTLNVKGDLLELYFY